MLRFAERLGATARCIGALNALRREADGSWTGDMFDGAGSCAASSARASACAAGASRCSVLAARAAPSRARWRRPVSTSIAVIDPIAGRAAALAETLRHGVSRLRDWRPRTRCRPTST